MSIFCQTEVWLSLKITGMLARNRNKSYALIPFFHSFFLSMCSPLLYGPNCGLSAGFFDACQLVGKFLPVLCDWRSMTGWIFDWISASRKKCCESERRALFQKPAPRWLLVSNASLPWPYFRVCLVLTRRISAFCIFFKQIQLFCRKFAS